MRIRTSMRAAAAVAALALAATACGGGDGESESSSASASAPGDESEAGGSESAASGDYNLVNEGQLTVCSDIPYAPFEFESEGEFTGFDIELVRAIADELGLEANVVATGFDPIQSGTALAAGQCDLAASAITITEERKANLAFTDPYYDAKQSLLVPVDSDITDLESTDGKTIGVQSATTGEAYFNENAPEGATAQSFENPGDLFVALESGQIDGILQDLPVNAERARTDENVEVIEEFDTGEQYGMAASPDNTALVEAVNEALAGVEESGQYDELYDKYFSTEPSGGASGSEADAGAASETSS